MARKPFGAWQPSTEAQDAQATDFANDALRAEAERQGKALITDVTEPQGYLVGGQVLEVDPRVVRGLMEAKRTK